MVGRERVMTVVRAARARQRRFEAWLDRRYPKLYDARHAATGIGQALGPLVGPLLAAVILLPLVALLAALVALLGLHAPSIDLPSVDLPDLPAIPWPGIHAPGWLRAIGEALGAVLGALATASKYVFIAVVVVLGLHRTRAMRRRRAAAEQIGRPELLRRLAVTLGAVRAAAAARGAAVLGDACAEVEESGEDASG